MFKHLTSNNLPTGLNDADKKSRAKLFASVCKPDAKRMSLRDARSVCRELGMYEIADVEPIVRMAFDSSWFMCSTVVDMASSKSGSFSFRAVPSDFQIAKHGSDSDAVLPKGGFRLFLTYLERSFKLKMIFNAVDTHHEKMITLDELQDAQKALKSHGFPLDDVCATFRDMDTDESGEVDFAEFADWVLRKALSEDVITE